MAMNDKAIPTEQLATAAAGHLNLAPDSLRFSRCATGKYNSTWFVNSNSEGPLVMRVAPPDIREHNLFYEHRMMRQEPGIHRTILKQDTSTPVPRIIADDFSHRLLGRDFLLMERMPGRPLSESVGMGRREHERLLGELGSTMRNVHAIHAGRHGYIGEHQPAPSAASWTEAFVVMWDYLLRDIERCGGYSSAEADSMRQLLDAHLDKFTRSEPASLLHMDVWAQNIMTGPDGELLGLLDWDRALWGDTEIEFAVLDYCGISEPSFWEGYGSVRDSDSAARVRQVFYMLYELQKYIFIRRVRGGNPSLASNYRLQSLQLAGQIGLRL
jgi:aminoglycoside phosphotransferase (APT) family kinase protein